MTRPFAYEVTLEDSRDFVQDGVRVARPIADDWQVCDNSLARKTLVARAGRNAVAEVVAPGLWAMIERGPPRP